MTLFNDLEEILNSEGYVYSTVAEDFFTGDEEYYTGNHWKTGEPYDNTPEVLRNINIQWERLCGYGGEDQGSNYWSVYKFTRGDEECTIKFDGWYASHHGAEFEEFFEVKPTQKTVTVYE